MLRRFQSRLKDVVSSAAAGPVWLVASPPLDVAVGYRFVFQLQANVQRKLYSERFALTSLSNRFPGSFGNRAASHFRRVEVDCAVFAFLLDRDGDGMWAEQLTSFAAQPGAAGCQENRHVVIVSGDNGVGRELAAFFAVEPVATATGTLPGVSQHGIVGSLHRVQPNQHHTGERAVEPAE